MTMAVSKSKAQRAACQANQRIIADAIIQYQALHDGAYPPNLDVLVDEQYIKDSFNWTCPSGNYEAQSGDYLKYYDPAAGQTSCPRPNNRI